MPPLCLIATLLVVEVGSWNCGRISGDIPPFWYILGGREVNPPKLWPWLVNIRLRDVPIGRAATENKEIHCSGAMVANNLLVTAAHCLHNPLTKCVKRE